MCTQCTLSSMHVLFSDVLDALADGGYIHAGVPKDCMTLYYSDVCDAGCTG